MKKYLSFVKFEHTLFSLPIVIAGAVAAAKGIPDFRTAVLIISAATGARTAALAMNRIADRRIDSANPRTKNRELPSGALSLFEGYAVAAAGLAVYFVSALLLCRFAFYLSPVPVAAFALYPFMKRKTALCHFGVGFALALAPAGGWIAVRCGLDDLFIPLMLCAFTFFWVSGFDIVYSTLDEKFDRENGLHSLPVLLGSKKALWVSALLHALCVIPPAALQLREFNGNIFSLSALGALCAVLAFEQIKASRTDLAFFKLNIAAGALVLVFAVCGIYLG